MRASTGWPATAKVLGFRRAMAPLEIWETLEPADPAEPHSVSKSWPFVQGFPRSVEIVVEV